MSKRIQYITFFLVFAFGCQYAFAQQLNENYMLFSKSNEYSEYLEFKNDSVVTRKRYISLLGCSLAKLQADSRDDSIFKDYRYKKYNNTITIYNFDKSSQATFTMTNKNYFASAATSLIYVLRSSFDKYPAVVVNFENEFFWLEDSVKNPKKPTRITRKARKKSRKFNRIIRRTNIKKHFILEVYKGYEAFDKFGYEYVFGIITLKRKS